MKTNLIVIAFVFVALIWLAVAYKNSRKKGVLKWTNQQNNHIQEKLDKMVLCPDGVKDKKIAKCVLKELNKEHFNDIYTEMSTSGENSDRIQSAMATCFTKYGCTLPTWSEDQKKKAFDLIVKRDLQQGLCNKPDVTAKRAMCQLEHIHKLMSYEDFNLMNQQGFTPAPKIQDQLDFIRGQCYTQFNCADKTE